MNEKRMDCIFRCFILCVIFSLVSSLKLEHQVTSRPHHLRKNTTPQTIDNSTKIPKAVATTATKGVVLYRVATSGQTCILLKTDGLVEVYFKSHNVADMAETYMSDDAIIEGNCNNEDTASMKISWEGYALILNFAKTPGGERWYVSQIELRVSTAIERYHSIRGYLQPFKTFKLLHTQMLFPTPVGKSFACDESIIDLTFPKEEFNSAALSGKLFLRTFQVQPFMYKGDSFGPAYDCNSQMAFRDETAPIAVGSTLAIAVLATVTGYAIYRYFKVKKVQYNAME